MVGISLVTTTKSVTSNLPEWIPVLLLERFIAGIPQI